MLVEMDTLIELIISKITVISADTVGVRGVAGAEAEAEEEACERVKVCVRMCERVQKHKKQNNNYNNKQVPIWSPKLSA